MTKKLLIIESLGNLISGSQYLFSIFFTEYKKVYKRPNDLIDVVSLKHNLIFLSHLKSSLICVIYFSI